MKMFCLTVLSKILATRKCKGEHTRELTEILNELIKNKKGEKIKKQTIPFVCETRTIYDLFVSEMIDIFHDGNRGFVWKIERVISFLVSWIAETNRYDPTFALEKNKSGGFVLLPLDAGNRTNGIILCFSGHEQLYRFVNSLPKTFRGNLRVGYSKQENQDFSANCNNFERQTAGEMINVTPGKLVFDAKEYIQSNSGLYSGYGDVYEYITDFKSTRFNHLEFEAKCLVYIDSKLYKKTKMPGDIFDIRDILRNNQLDSRTASTHVMYKQTIINALKKIHTSDPSYRLDKTNLAWTLTMFMELELLNIKIKHHDKFVKSLNDKIDEINRINKNTEKCEKKILLKTNLTHHFKDDQKNVINYLMNDIKKSPKKYGLR